MPRLRARVQPPRPTSETAAEVEYLSGSVEQTHQIGEQIGRALQPGDAVALHGELGSGKTTLTQGIAKGLGGDPETVKSPTFVLVREHRGAVPLIHIDGYRLDGAAAAAWLDLDLLFAPQHITVVEWADRFQGLLPAQTIEVHLKHVSAHRRAIRVASAHARGRAVIEALRAWTASELEPPVDSGSAASSETSTTERADETPGD